MGTNELRKRKIWQDVSGGKAGVAEKKFFDIFTKEFEGTDFRIRSKPREFKDIYSKIKLTAEILKGIYNPDETLFLQKGKEQGGKTKNGLEMLQLQAEKSLEIWNKR